MEIQSSSLSPATGVGPRPPARPALEVLLEQLVPVQSLPPGLQNAHQAYFNQVLGDSGALGGLPLAELPPLPDLGGVSPSKVSTFSLDEAMQAHGQTASTPVRNLLQERLQELVRRGTELFRAPDTDESKKKKKSSWQEDMREVGPPREADGPASVDQLITELGLRPDSKEAGEVRNLSTKMLQCSRSLPKIHGFMRDIAKRHGVAMLGKVCEKLNAYLSAHWNDRANGKPVDEDELVECALRDVAHPTGVGQANKNCCPASAIHCKLAAERPLQFLDVLTTLASDQGYKLPDGSTLSPNNTWQGDANDGRRLSEKIMQNALMNLRGQAWDSANDDGKGMTRSQTERAIERVFGYSENDFDLDQPGVLTDKEDMWGYIEDDLARGRPVSVSFEGHSVMVVGYDPTRKPPNVLIATWGSVYTMSMPDFLRHVQAVRSVDDSGRDSQKLPGNRKTQLVD